jgi:hypothetical protein
MLILACFVLAIGIATDIEMDRELGGRFRYGAVTLSSIWGSMFMAVADDEQLAAGFVGYMLVMLTFMYVFGFIIVLVNKARERWGTWHNV